MKDALLQSGAKGMCLRLLACLLTFALVSTGTFFGLEPSFAADENTYGIEDIELVNADDPSVSYGASVAPDKVKTITISRKGGQVNLMCVAWWWPDGSNSTNPTSTTLVSSDEDIVSVYGMTITAVHDGDAYLTLTVSENTLSGEPLSVDIPVHVTGQDALYIESMNIYCEEADYYQYDGTGYLTVETETLYEIYLHFYLIVTTVNPSTGERVDYDTRNGMLSAQNEDLADPVWNLSDVNLGVVSDDGMFHPTEYGINSIWATSYGGLDGAYIRSGEIRCNFPDPEQDDPEAHPQDGITFNAWYETNSGENNSMPDDPDLVYTDYYDLNDLEHVGTFTETYTMVSGVNATAATAQGYGVDLEALLVEACGLDPNQGVSAIETLRFYDLSGAYKEMSASWLFQTRYYYPNIDIGSTGGTGVRVVKPMLAFDSWWQRGNDINWDAEMTDSTRFRLLFGSTSATESVTSYSWKWVNRVDVILYAQQTGNNKYTVTFDPANGSETFTEVVDVGGYASAPEAPTLDGYTFTGWYTEDGSLFDFATPITGNITLYAGWTVSDENPTSTDPNPDDSSPGQEGPFPGSGNRPNAGPNPDDPRWGSGGGSGSGDSSGDGSGGGSGQGGRGFNPNGNPEGYGGAGGGNPGFAFRGPREGEQGIDADSLLSLLESLGVDVGDLVDSGDSADSVESGVSTSGDLGSDASVADEQGSDAFAASGLGADTTDADEVGTGEWNMYQIMNPFTSDLGIDVEDNPIEPYVLPVAGGVLAAGGLESFLWFFVQRRRMMPLSTQSDDALVSA